MYTYAYQFRLTYTIQNSSVPVYVSICLSVTPMFSTQPLDCDQIRHVYADLPANGSYVKPIVPQHRGDQGGFRGRCPGNVTNCREHEYIFNPHPTGRLTVLRLTISKVREVAGTSEKNIDIGKTTTRTNQGGGGGGFYIQK